MKFDLDVPELSWINIPQTYLDSLSIEDIELKSKILFGLAIQKAHLNHVQRSILYNAICNEIETGCDKIQIICYTTIIDFAALYLEEISMLVKEKLLPNIGKYKYIIDVNLLLSMYSINKVILMKCFR